MLAFSSSRRMLPLSAVVLLAASAAASSALQRQWTEIQSVNPTLRSSTTWTDDDFERLFFDPNLHWCKGHHGHRDSRGPRLRCKGYPFAVMRALAEHRSPRNEVLAIRLLENPDLDLASRGAEVCGDWLLRESGPHLRAVLVRPLAENPWSTDGPTMVRMCAAWALERLGASEALDDLRACEAREPRRFAHAIAVMESRVSCAVCVAPHRK